ncbi:DUF6906 family protein [Clostridium sp.]|uniref:DUF6906 family protein n=1 Tax=Clostridium sp. TaxID=1506 RepID=UPI002915AB62|nr:hypothetical protein [Clostridium sp.]MDU3410987.1 hypothetical protein [Clostridium sp.]
MKKLKKLTRDQKKFLEKERLNPNDFLIERATPEEYGKKQSEEDGQMLLKKK